MSCEPPPSEFTVLCANAPSSELWSALQGVLSENGKLKDENGALRAENDDLKVRLAELEAKLGRPGKTPKNSSLPPSRGQKANDPEGTANKRSQASHPGIGRPLAANPDQTLPVLAEACPHCAAVLSPADQTVQQVYDRIEIPPIKPVITQVRRHGGICPGCGQGFLAPLSKGLEPGSPYGSSVVSLAIGLRYSHAISYERLSGLFEEVFGLAISEGALGNLFDRSRAAFAVQVAGIKAKLLASTVICSDETTMRVRTRTWWQWTFQNDQACVHIIRPSRGKDVPREFLGEVRPDFWVSDRLGSQQGWGTHWQVCLAHQFRDVQYAIDAGDRIFAPVVKRILLRAIVIGHRRDRLADSTLKQYRADLDRRLDAALKLEPAVQAGAKLRRQCLRFRTHFFVFVTNRLVPPTNNSSEQTLRPSTTFRKVTNCFRSDWGAAFFADVRSVVETGRRLGLTAAEAIRKTLNGEAFFTTATADG
jgi:transposase